MNGIRILIAAGFINYLWSRAVPLLLTLSADGATCQSRIRSDISPFASTSGMEREMDEEFDWRNPPSNPLELKKWKEKKKAQKRLWKEKKLIEKMEKQKAKEQEEGVKRRRLDEEQDVKANQGRQYTVSIALPGSILDNAQTPELRTYLAGQIARAAVVFNVDEIVIFDETGASSATTEGQFQGVGKKGNANVQLARILQYLECPQYLRKSFFPQHKDLQYAGLLNPLDCPHHTKTDSDCMYREGIVQNKPVKQGRGSLVDIGLYKPVQIDKKLQPGVRVTVKLDSLKTDNKKLTGCVQAPTAPRTNAGLYWGYSVRLAGSLGAVFTHSPYPGGYDLTIGTSERGSPVHEFDIPKFSHMLVVFGGVQGLECSLESDPDLQLDDPSLLFSHYLNTCPNQGSHTIRTEEAILISLSALKIQTLHMQTSNAEQASRKT